MADQVVEVVRLYVGRGLRTDPIGLEDEKLELSVDLQDPACELDQAMLTYEQLPTHVWLPLTTVVGGVPELVWETSDGLVPTQVPVPHLGAPNATVKTGEGITEAP